MTPICQATTSPVSSLAFTSAALACGCFFLPSSSPFLKSLSTKVYGLRTPILSKVMDDHLGTRPARDARGNVDLTESLYGTLPSRVLDMPSADLRAPSMPAKRLQDSKSAKRKGSGDVDDHSPRITLATYNNRGYFITTRSGKRGRLQLKKESHIDMHQSTCLNLDTSNNESDLWILPDFDEWELEVDSPQHEAPQRREGEWAPLVERAVNSNRERLRRRLEGDGWDFVGGKYGEDGKILKEMDVDNGESVDEEFDVVVLPVVQVSC